MKSIDSLSHHSKSRSRSRSRQKNHSKIHLIRQSMLKNSIPRLVDRDQHQDGRKGKEKKVEEEDDIDMFADNDDIHHYKSENKEQFTTDDEGYYNVVVGKTIGQKYVVIQKLGKGVFGVVIKAQHIETKKIFAIKILRKNPLTEKSGSKEYKILSTIQNPKHVMKVYDFFNEEDHLCLVCQLLGLDLRSYAHKKSMTLEQIRIIAISMFIILHQLEKNQIIHADIKPDNFLLKSTPDPSASEKDLVNNIKLCDFGTSYKIQQHSHKVQYMVARYYRAPQIMLGTYVKKSHSYALDVWAVGCSLYELYTGEFLFSGVDNNEMLKVIMQSKGKFSMKMINKSEWKEKHFDTDYNFLCRYCDKVTGQMRIKKVQPIITGERQLMNLLKSKKKEVDNMKNLQKFRDFLQKCLTLNPKDRLKSQEALQHPFLHYQMKLN